MDFVKRKKWSILASILLFVVLWINYEPAIYPVSFQIHDFPLILQPDQITCGPTSAAMVLRYYGHDVDIDAIKIKTRTQWFSYKGEAVGMTAPSFVQTSLKHFGLPAKTYRTDIDRVKYFVSQYRPPILLVRSGWKTWHYVVVVGYDKNNMVLADPGYGKLRSISCEKLENAWAFTSDLRGTDFRGNDYWKVLLESSDVKDHMLIVPKKPIDRR